MSKLGIVGATAALSLALAVATPAFAARLPSGGAMNVGIGGFRGAQASAVSSADASYCAQLWAYYDAASGKAWATMVSGVLAHKSKKRAA